MEKDPAVLKTENVSWMTPLHFASMMGRKDIAETLISLGADIDAKNRNDWTPIIYPLRNGNIEMIELLLDKGADLNFKTGWGESYLHYAAFMDKLNLVELFLNRGIDIDVVKNGNLTPLHIASILGHKEIVEFLVERGADLDIKSTDGATPLHYSQAARHPDIEDYLKSRGAKDIPRTFPEYRGAYLGKKAPGTEPEPFAPELFRDIYRTHSTAAFSSDGKEIYWEAIFMTGNNNASRVWFMKEENGKWTAPAVAPFSDYPSGGPALSHDGAQRRRRAVHLRTVPGEADIGSNQDVQRGRA